jgi:hypothetical protein
VKKSTKDTFLKTGAAKPRDVVAAGFRSIEDQLAAEPEPISHRSFARSKSTQPRTDRSKPEARPKSL